MKKLTCIGGALTGVLFSFPIMAAELRIGLQDDPDVLDPHQSRTFVGRIVYAGLCDKLVDITPELEIVPQLATDWEWSDDASQLVMDLREGVVFHDGTPFDAQAVVANIERAMTLPESRRRSELASVDTVEATGDYQVTFTLTSPDASLLAQLTDRAGMMLSPEAFEEMGANFGSNPVCSGPMRFVERVQQDRIVLEKFEDYWNAENIFIDRVTYLPIPDATVRLANLRSGDINMLERLAASDATAVQNAANLTYEEVVGLGYQALYVNIDNGPRADNPMGNDNRLRQAFSLAIDRDAINQVVFEGTQSPGNQPFPPSSPWYNADIPVPERDVEAARALMQEAGFERLEVELQVGNNPVQMQMMQVVQSMVAEAGFDVRLQATEYTTLLSEQTAGNFQLSRSDWSGRIDPDGNLHQFVTCEGGINDVRYCNPEVDALLDEARTFTEPSARKERYDAATQILQDDMPVIYLGHQSYIWAMDEAIEGFVPSPDGMIRLTGMQIAE
ncbi:ABC transporter substrate-binding protein [Billgrantia endophytica]|uniref:ABC transporter substrate-binding protein n=1 Tax=Billgrantia endophytica TaxID=2033802 RepID=A0A2N7U5E7_9GAMM|nr:ABC transporter substrate-binding protein [Halomonas endophytica]PMR75653.1 ABC transporter substrate-binding protein [Halomonas endophytica]